MMYNPKTKSFEIEVDVLNFAYDCLVLAMRNVRDLAGLPYGRYKRNDEGPLLPVDHAQRKIIEAAQLLGIDMGGEWGEDIDLRQTGE